MHRLSDSRWLSAAGVALLFLQLACFASYLAHFQYLPGTDAYYYALQAQSINDSGHLKIADSDAIPYVISAVSKLGLSIESSFKFVLFSTCALFNLGFLFFLFALKQTTRPFAFFLWLAACPLISFHAIEFPKLSLALALIPLWFCFVTGDRKSRILWLLLLLAASSLLHPAAVLLSIPFLLTVALQNLFPPFQLSERRFFRPVLFGTFACAVFCAIFIALKSSAVSRIASYDRGQPGIVSVLKADDIPLDFKLVVISCWILLALAFVRALRARSRSWLLLTGATLLLPLCPNGHDGLLGVGGRLAVLFVFPALPLTLVVWEKTYASGSPALFLRLHSWLAIHNQPAKLWTNRVFTLAGIAALISLPARLTTYRPLLMNQDSAAYEKLVASLRGEDIPMLIAHRGLDFFYSYRLRRDAFHFEPERNWNRTNIWRVTVRITPEEAAYYLPPTCPWGITAHAIPRTDYLLIREDCWEQFRASLNANENPDLYTEAWHDMANPSQPRPAFLRIRHAHDPESPFPAPVEKK